jgi:hypothetical protein
MKRLFSLFALITTAAMLIACGDSDPYAGQPQLKISSTTKASTSEEHYKATHGEVHVNKIATRLSSHGIIEMVLYLKVDRSKAEWNGWRFEEAGFHRKDTIDGPQGRTVRDWRSEMARSYQGSDHYFFADFQVGSNYHKAVIEYVYYIKLRHSNDPSRVRYLWVNPSDGSGQNFIANSDEYKRIAQIRERMLGYKSISGAPDDAVPTYFDELYRRYNPWRPR